MRTHHDRSTPHPSSPLPTLDIRRATEARGEGARHDVGVATVIGVFPDVWPTH
jgi:hypothetical protein